MTEAILDIRDGRYFAAIAFVYGDKNRDWLCSAWRDPGGPWHITGRFRYIADERVFDSADEKREFGAVDNRGRSEEEIVQTLRRSADDLVVRGFNDKLDWIDVKSDDSMTVFTMLAARPWAHIKTDAPVGDA